MSEDEQLRKAIARLKTMNSDLRENIDFLRSPMSTARSGPDQKGQLIRDWERHIERNELLIAEWEAELAQGT